MGFALAFALGIVALRLGLPPLVGYLAAGVVVGPSTPGFVGDAGLAAQLAEIGVILLMFGVGLHFSPRDLLSVRGVAVPGAVAQILAATGMGTLLGRALGWDWGEGIVFGLALSVASTVVLLRALEERGLVESTRGRIAVGWLVVEDGVMVLALVLLPAFSGALGGRPPEGDTPLALSVATTVGAAAVFVALMMLLGRTGVPWLLERAAATGSRELFTLGVLAAATGVALGASELFGVSFALGAFAAGMVLNSSELSHAAAEDSLPLRDAFAVLFFVSVGMLLNPSVLVDRPLEVLATVAVIVVGKSVVAWIIVRAFGRSSGTASTVAVSLAQIGEFSFILAAVGMDLEILSADTRDLVLAGAIIAIAMNPLLFRWLERREAAAAPDEPPAPAVAAGIAGHAVVIGHGRVGGRVSASLRTHGVPVVVVEEDDDRAPAREVPVVVGNGGSERVLEAAAVERAAVVVVATPRPHEAAEIVRRVRRRAPRATILARAHSDAEVELLGDHGADRAVMAERVLGDTLADAALRAAVAAVPGAGGSDASGGAQAPPDGDHVPSAADGDVIRRP